MKKITWWWPSYFALHLLLLRWLTQEQNGWDMWHTQWKLQVHIKVWSQWKKTTWETYTLMGNIKMDLGEMGCDDVKNIQLVQYRVQWQASVLNTATNFQVLYIQISQLMKSQFFIVPLQLVLLNHSTLHIVLTWSDIKFRVFQFMALHCFFAELYPRNMQMVQWTRTHISVFFYSSSSHKFQQPSLLLFNILATSI